MVVDEMHPAIAAGVVATEEEARALDDAWRRLNMSGIRVDYDAMVTAVARGQTLPELERIVAEQMATDRAARKP